MGLLDVRQRNNLLTGNELAAELPASAVGQRAFVVVWARCATTHYDHGDADASPEPSA